MPFSKPMPNKMLGILLKEAKPIFNSRKDDGKTIFWFNSSKQSIDVIDENSKVVAQYNMRYREFACNWLLCAAFDYIFGSEHYFTADDRDGTILSTSSLQRIKTEHVMAFDYGVTTKNSQEIEELTKDTIINKLKKGGSFQTGEIYLKDRILVVNIQFPHDLAYDIGSIMRLITKEKPTFLPEIYFIGQNKELDDNHFIFSISRVNLSKHVMATYFISLDLINFSWNVWLYKQS